MKGWNVGLVILITVVEEEYSGSYPCMFAVQLNITVTRQQTREHCDTTITPSINLPLSPRMSGGFRGAAICCPLRADAGDRVASILLVITCEVTCLY